MSLFGLDRSERNQPHQASDSSILFEGPLLMRGKHSQDSQANPLTVHVQMHLVVDFIPRGLTSGFVPYADTVSTFSASGSQMGSLQPPVCQASVTKAESESFNIEISFQIQ